MDCKLEQEIERKDALELYLESIVGERLYKDEQLELIEKINLKDSRNRQQKSINQLNAYLIDNFDMTVLSKPKYKVIDGKKKKLTYWILTKIEE